MLNWMISPQGCTIQCTREPVPSLDEEVNWVNRMDADTTVVEKKDEKNQMNMTNYLVILREWTTEGR